MPCLEPPTGEAEQPISLGPAGTPTASRAESSGIDDEEHEGLGKAVV